MDAYTEHLTNIRKTNTVIATADICNSQGQLLVPAGSKIDEMATNRIVKFKLLKPIEECVAIENDLNGEKLKAKIIEYISSDPFLAEVHMLAEVDVVLQKCCDAYDEHPILRQKMTVMSMELARPFQNAIFTAWFSVLIAPRHWTDERYVHCAFISALTHDIGLMHIDPSVLTKVGSLTLEEVKQVHVHPIVGHRILSGVSCLPSAVATAVEEHHENIDGTGFPAGKLGKDFNEFGRLIHLLDNAFGVYDKHVKPFGRSVVDIIPIMAMNYYSQKNPFFKSFVNILRTSTKVAIRNISDESIASFIDKTLQGHEYIHRFLDNKQDIVSKFGHQHGSSRLFAIQNAYLHIYSLMAESGLLDEPYMQWLELVQDQKIEHAYKEAEESYFMLREIIFQIQRVKQLAQVYFEDPRNAAQLAKAPNIMDQINVKDVPYIEI